MWQYWVCQPRSCRITTPLPHSRPAISPSGGAPGVFRSWSGIPSRMAMTVPGAAARISGGARSRTASVASRMSVPLWPS